MTTTTKAAHTPLNHVREFEVLQEYIQLREELCDLEARESECTCNVNDFHTCPLCELAKEKIHRSRVLMDLWGDNWAVLLHQHAEMLEALERLLINDGISNREFARAAIQKTRGGQ